MREIIERYDSHIRQWKRACDPNAHIALRDKILAFQSYVPDADRDTSSYELFQWHSEIPPEWENFSSTAPKRGKSLIVVVLGSQTISQMVSILELTRKLGFTTYLLTIRIHFTQEDHKECEALSPDFMILTHPPGSECWRETKNVLVVKELLKLFDRN